VGNEQLEEPALEAPVVMVPVVVVMAVPVVMIVRVIVAVGLPVIVLGACAWVLVNVLLPAHDAAFRPLR
jgi:hypothetical protein